MVRASMKKATLKPLKPLKPRMTAGKKNIRKKPNGRSPNTSWSPATIILIFSFGVYVWVVFLRPFPQGSRTRATKGSDIGSVGSTIDPIPSDVEKCDRLLDRFDRAFDDRRIARWQRIKAFFEKQAKNKVTPKTPPRIWFMLKEESDCYKNHRSYFRDHFSPQTIDRLVKANNCNDWPKVFCSSNNAKENHKSCLVYTVREGTISSIARNETLSVLFGGCETRAFRPETFGVVVHPENKHEPLDHPRGRPRKRRSRVVDLISIDCLGCEGAVLPALLDAISAGELVVHQIHAAMSHRWFVSHGSNDAVLELFGKIDKAQFRILSKNQLLDSFGEPILEYVFVSREYLRHSNKEVLCR